jgi:hypothetical protein
LVHELPLGEFAVRQNWAPAAALFGLLRASGAKRRRQRGRMGIEPT